MGSAPALEVRLGGVAACDFAEEFRLLAVEHLPLEQLQGDALDLFPVLHHERGCAFAQAADHASATGPELGLIEPHEPGELKPRVRLSLVVPAAPQSSPAVAGEMRAIAASPA